MVGAALFWSGSEDRKRKKSIQRRNTGSQLKVKRQADEAEWTKKAAASHCSPEILQAETPILLRQKEGIVFLLRYRRFVHVRFGEKRPTSEQLLVRLFALAQTIRWLLYLYQDCWDCEQHAAVDSVTCLSLSFLAMRRQPAQTRQIFPPLRKLREREVGSRYQCPRAAPQKPNSTEDETAFKVQVLNGVTLPAMVWVLPHYGDTQESKHRRIHLRFSFLWWSCLCSVHQQNENFVGICKVANRTMSV